MTFSLHDIPTQEKRIIDTLLWFVNLRVITSTEQVEEKFMQIASDKFQVIPPGDVQPYVEDQAALKLVLQNLIERGRFPGSFVKRFGTVLREKVHPRLNFIKGQVVVEYAIDGVEAGVALGLALLLDKEREIGLRLRQCGNPACHKFVLDLSGRGRPRTHCNQKCAKAADAAKMPERVKRYREKKRAASQ